MRSEALYISHNRMKEMYENRNTSTSTATETNKTSHKKKYHWKILFWSDLTLEAHKSR